jgi:hypothetical protein
MPAIGTSGSMSGDGKRGVGHSAPSYRAHPRLYLCDITKLSVDVRYWGANPTRFAHTELFSF